MIGEDGTEGYSDLFRENAMLQKENSALRMRVKAMQEAIDAINSRVTYLMSQEANLMLAKAGEAGLVGAVAGQPGQQLGRGCAAAACASLHRCLCAAGDGNEAIGALIQNYIREIEELR